MMRSRRIHDGRARWWLFVAAISLQAELWPAAAPDPDVQALHEGAAAEPRFISVDGRLLDPEGRPVSTGQVAIVDERKHDPGICSGGWIRDGCFERLAASGAVRAETRSGTDGRFTFQVPGGLSNLDRLWAQGVDAAGRNLRVSWPVGPNRRVSGTTLGDVMLHRRRELVLIVQGEGRPLVDAEVDFGDGQTLRTDGTGLAFYALYTPPESQLVHVALTIRAEGFAGEGWATGLPAGTTTHVMNLVREEVLTGRVVDAQGRPVPGVVVSARAAEPWPGVGIRWSDSTAPDQTVGTARTNAAGSFSLRGLRAAERYLLTMTAPDISVENAERIVTAGGAAIEVTLSSARSVRLAISGLKDGPLERLGTLRPGEPGPGISLEWFDRASGAWQRVSAPRRIDWLGSGRAELHFDQVPFGLVRVVSEGDWTTAADAFDPVQLTESTPTVIPVSLVRNVELRLRVHDTSGRPVHGARVEVFSHTGRASAFTNTSADGSVAFRVHAAHDVKVTVTIGQTVAATVVARGGGDAPTQIVVPVR